jgi:site-specific DNA-methyltransferase (adenine-specific)
VLTSALPRHRSEFDLALRSAGPDAIFDVIDVFDDEARARLASYAAGATEQLPGFWYPDDLTD